MGEALPLDHLVYAVSDLDRASGELESQIGVRPTPGGRHEGLGTHNALLSLGAGRYLELIAPDPTQSAPPGPRPFGLDELDGSRLVTWAVRTSDIEATAARAKEAGYDPGRVLAVSRNEPSGETLRWKLTLRAEPLGDGLVPFVIDWEGCPHPSTTSPQGCEVLVFRAEHPDPDPVRAALDSLGATLDVKGAETVRLTAELAGPGGRVFLRG